MEGMWKILIFVLLFAGSQINTYAQNLNISWATYFGSIGYDEGDMVTTDKFGNVYICGVTYSSYGLATSGAFKTSGDRINGDVFLAKFDAKGIMLWATYFGGESSDFSPSICTDNKGN